MACLDRILDSPINWEVIFKLAFNLLRDFVDLREVDATFPLRSNAVYTNGLSIWLMVLQRMTPAGTLESTVKQLLESGSGLLRKNKRVTEKTLSANTGDSVEPESEFPWRSPSGSAIR